MMTVKQVATRTGISVRTLQFYDEIGLLRPTQVTDAGYRLYDEAALEVLQQILFFKELDFTLKEIKTILADPQFDRAAAFAKQRELIQMKRDRLDSLLGLLDQLIKGENCMDFAAFDMSEYLRALAAFKQTHTDAIVERMGSLEAFDAMLEDLSARKGELAEQAVQQYGSVEAFTRAMEQNFQAFLESGPTVQPSEVEDLTEQTDVLTRALTADLRRDVQSAEVQREVAQLIALCDQSNAGLDLGDHYWQSMAELYRSNPTFIQGTDQKYGTGAADFISRAILAHLAQR